MIVNNHLSYYENLLLVKHIKLSLILVLIGLSTILISQVLFSDFDEIEIGLMICIGWVSFLYYWSCIDTASIVTNLMLWSLTILVSYLAWHNIGLFDTALTALPAIILLALMLNAPLLSLPLILFIIVIIFFLLYSHNNNYITLNITENHNYFVRATDITIIYLFTSVIFYRYIQDIKRTMTKLQSNNHQLKQQLKRTEKLNNYDSLTLLPNERICAQHIVKQLDTLAIENKLLAFITLDLHNLRTINNSLGYDNGDQLLIALAKRLTSIIHEDESLYRFQGVEFILLKVSKSHEQQQRFIEQIIQVLNQPFIINDYEVELIVSLGVAIAPFDGKDLASLRQKSHLALQQSSNKNTSSFQFYDQQMSAIAEHKYALIQSLKSAISQNKLALHYQAKVDLSTQHIIGAEALLRWHHDERGFISPEVFIPLAEESGIIVQMTKWLINQACQDCAQWHNQGLHHLTVAINLSPIDFRRGNLPNIVIQALQKHGLSPHYVELEITESIIIDDISHIQNQIHQLHSKGITFAIDDFGTGYSNLGYLNKFNVGTLKIDRSFVSKIVDSEHDYHIVKAIIKMSQSLGITNVAEGIEDQKTMELLQTQNCQIGQGYYWSKPLPNQEFISFASSWKS
ncbi:bifunctional diguanylate cyclase/phosphodiesterase [Thalassotalea sp. G2M2-11]|uniref:putative bifunctional diguanylate cyclase/phosphodiesterase n=1 Tax=Thalassotalea sp. G2M2-11 TaxID=2787627 RepID=UPI0019D0B1DB|nr:bifunctional diguanylate cyclase/phosphodiesterase [Thalassotalea sp. G2M2-11]